MPNEENLKKGEPYRFRTGEQQVETARKGGIASGEARRRKKAMRDTAKMLLDMQVPKAAKELKQKLAVMGISEEDFTYQTAVMVGVINQAMKGNTKAAAFLRDTVGENPAHELRERELDQKIAEFEYHRQQEEAQRKENESTSSLADAIEEAYRNRIPQRHSWEKHIKTQLRICTPQGKTLRQPHLCWRLWQIKVERVLKLVRHWEL